MSIGPPGDRVSVSLLTGFLGSGKTTLLNRLLRDPRMGQTAVVVNEFGDVALDHLLVESATEEMVVLESGCVCCSVRNDLLETLLELWDKRERGETPRFERVVIETTGLADPAPILRTLMIEADIAENYWLDAVLTTIDVVNADASLDTQFESVKQAALADRLLLTKADLLAQEHDDAEARIAKLEDRLWDLNPSAPHVRIDPEALDPDALFDVALFQPGRARPDVDNWLRDDAWEGSEPAASKAEHAHRHDASIASYCVTWHDPIPVQAFEGFLTALMHFRGPDLLRVKGLVRLAELDRPAVIHLVQHAFHEPIVLDEWPSEDRRTRIVFITRGIDKGRIEALLRTTLDAVADDSVYEEAIDG